MTRPWDQVRWAVEAGEGATIEIETSSALTWTLRALVSAGEAGFRPAAEKREHWDTMTVRLRDLGVPVLVLPSDAIGQPGYRLGVAVHRVT